MERSYDSAIALVRPAVGPLAAHLSAFVASLIVKQYSINCVYIKGRHALAFDRWLATHGVTLADLSESDVARYNRRRSSRCRRSRRVATRRREWCVMMQLLQFLREQGACPLARGSSCPADEVVGGFERYLRHERGLADATIGRVSTTARQLLISRFGKDQVDLGALRAADVVAFVQHESKRVQPQVVKNTVTGLRAFLRYAQYCGAVGADLVASVPAVATWVTTPPLPKAISADHAQRAIESCDRGTAVGRRDRAVLLLLARLGLRTCEIFRLLLDDIDWDQGHVRIRGKGGRQCLLPLPTDVGEAIAAYLQDGRPASADRHVFLRSHAPIRGLMEGSDAIGSIVRYALRRAKVDAPHRGAHQFRHALAVCLLQRGASLSEIGEVLRHRSPQSTAIYATIDVEALRALALAWPGGAR